MTTLTKEQSEILYCNGPLIAIQAFAGSGKTTILEWYTSIRDKKRFLYLSFNKDAKKSAEKRFPSNVECKTIDSVCLGLVFSKSKPLMPFNIQLIKRECKQIENDTKKCWKCFELLSGYISSGNIEDFLEWINRTQTSFDCYKHKIEIDQVNDLWNKYKRGRTFWMSHSMNRKLALINTEGSEEWLSKRYDCILVDECQDLNPVMLGLIMLFKGQKVFVGDTHQAIYSFMGNINAFTVIEPSDSFNLSQSWRFGTDLANYASNALERTKGIILSPKLSGTPSLETKIVKKMQVVPKSEGQITYLARINRTIFEKCASLLQDKENEGITVHWKSKTEFFHKINDLLFLKEGDISKWAWKRKTATNDEDIETLSLMNLIDDNGVTKIKKIQALVNEKTAREGKANYIFSTVHKAKGLEWDNVILDKDIMFYLERAKQKIEEVTISFGADSEEDEFFTSAKTAYIEECNIYYVAITRAKKLLQDDSRKIDDKQDTIMIGAPPFNSSLNSDSDNDDDESPKKKQKTDLDKCFL